MSYASETAPPTQIQFLFSSFPSSSQNTPYLTSQFSDIQQTQLPFSSFFNFSQLAPDIQTHQFPSIPSSSTQNLISSLTTKPHEVPTPLQQTREACPNMYHPCEPNVEDGDDDDDDDGIILRVVGLSSWI